MKLKIKIKNFLEDQKRYRVFPPVIVATFFGLIPHLGISDYQRYAGLQTVDVLMHPAIFVILIVATLGYLRLVYEKEWKGYWHWRKKYKMLHYFSFGFTGIVASMIPYCGGVGLFFFTMYDQQAGSTITEYLPYLWAYQFIFSLMAMDVFNSLGGKGIYFKMTPINRMPIRNYSYLERKIRKHLPSIANKIIFTK